MLIIIDVVTGEERGVDIDPQSFNDYAMLYFAWRVVWWSTNTVFFITANRGGTRYGLVAVDLVGAHAREVVSETAERAVCLNQCDYNFPNVHVTSDGEELIWYSERTGIGHLYLYDVKTGELKNTITDGNAPVFDLIRVDERRRRIFFVGASREPNSNPYLRYLHVVNFDGGPVTLITCEVADHRFNNCMQPFMAIAGGREGDVLPGSSISPDGQYLVDSYSTIATPPRYSIHLLPYRNIKHELLSADASDLLKDGWRPPEEFVVKGADGMTDLWGSITFPREFDVTKSYAVIDTMYPGPQGSFSPRCFVDQLAGGSIHHLQTFADAGFVVVTLDGRGTRHRSREFHDAFFGTIDVFGAQDHRAAIVNLAIERPYINLSRVGVRGQSFGGYGALRAMLLFPQFFKVGVCATGPGDYMDAQGQTFVERFFGVPGASDAIRQHYRDISSLSAARNLSGRALLVHGGLDENVPLKHAFALFDAFIGADKDVDMLLVPNSPHSVPKEPYVVRRSVQYFLDHL